jgi:uncharacterized protein HemY
MKRDVRFAALGLALAAVALGGLVLGLGENDDRAQFDARFRQAVSRLQQGEHAQAAAALHDLLQVAPEVPELRVNLGYAMLGLKKYAAARDSFSAAIDLRPRQANAYYGLAESLEGLGDLRGALGAMRTYVHLSAPDDPFVRKAHAAIWEWEAR